MPEASSQGADNNVVQIMQDQFYIYYIVDQVYCRLNVQLENWTIGFNLPKKSYLVLLVPIDLLHLPRRAVISRYIPRRALGIVVDMPA